MEELIKKAQEAMKNAYAPYSKFHVGAAIRLKDGNIVIGANIENASYGLTNCAERTCIFQVYSLGYRKEDIVDMALVSDFTGHTTPCGACRQVLSELYPADAPIYLVSKDNKETVYIKDLLPLSFSSEDIK